MQGHTFSFFGEKIMDTTKVLIADDHPLFRTALTQAVTQCMADVAIIEAETVEQLFSQVNQHKDIELIFLDLHMPGNDGFTTLTQLQNHYPDITVIMVSSDDEPNIMSRAVDFGAAAFIPKSANLTVISQAIDSVLGGETWLPQGTEQDVSVNEQHKQLAQQLAELTPQQYVVLSRIADGQLNKQIAYDLDIKETTVKKHVSAILLKLQVSNRTLAGMAFQQLKLTA